nr:T9SS type A sorting domain-containing protein [Bacteroidota bacterium]
SNLGGFDFLIPLEELDDGYHLLFVRIQDTTEVWTQTMSRSFLKTRLLSDPDPTIVQVEYFVDTDPGYGLGESLAVNNVATPVVDALISLDGYDDGLHNIFVRSQDENGRWSETFTRPFLKSYVPTDAVNITNLEYFIDTDPGVGFGTAVSVPNPSANVERSFVVNLALQTPGEHRLFVRSVDDRGHWSIVYNQLIEVTSTGAVHVVQLAEGWSGISSYVIPDDASVENLFAPVQNSMVILQNYAGMYWPTAGVNTLINWDDRAGYQVKMEDAQQVTFSGTMQENLTANLTIGWNYLPVLNACDNQVEDLLSSIVDHVQIVKDVAGWGVYWPQFGINTLEEINPGKAYFVLVDEDVSLEFPECTPTDMTPIPAFPLEGEGDPTRMGVTKLTQELEGGLQGGTPLLLQEKGLGDEVPTPITHIIAIPKESTSGLYDLDIIRVYSNSGQCYGAVQYQNQNLVLTIFGDDPTTAQIDGMIAGETMQFRAFNPEIQKEFLLELEFDDLMPHGEYFVNHGLSAVKSLEATGMNDWSQSGLSVSVYPNPSHGLFNIQFGENIQDFSWAIMNIHGSVIASGESVHNFSINLSSHPKGIYYLKISVGGLLCVEKLVLQ